MAPHHSRSIGFKRQVAQEFVSGETLHGLAKRHDVSRNLIRIWVQKYEAGAFDDDATAADMIQEYEARIVAVERLASKQALELEFLKGAVKSARGREAGLHSLSSALLQVLHRHKRVEARRNQHRLKLVVEGMTRRTWQFRLRYQHVSLPFLSVVC